MCKAFDEMQEMGWIGAERPRMVGGAGGRLRADCSSLGSASNFGAVFPERRDSCIRSARPGPLGDRLILSMLRQTKGTALTVTDDEMLHAARELASLEGIFAAPEGAATVSAARKLAASGWIKPEETVVLFNTGTGYKYAEAWQRALAVGQRRIGVTRADSITTMHLKRVHRTSDALRSAPAGCERRNHRQHLGADSGPHGVLSDVWRPAQRFGQNRRRQRSRRSR